MKCQSLSVKSLPGLTWPREETNIEEVVMKVCKTVLMIGVLAVICGFIGGCWSSQTYDVRDLKICYYESGKVKSVEFGKITKNSTVVSLSTEELQAIADIAKLVKTGVSLADAVKSKEEETGATIVVHEKDGTDSTVSNVNLVRDAAAESELETLFPIPNQHWVVFKLDPEDTLEVQNALAMYDSADVFTTSTLEVEADTSYTVFPPSFPITYIEYPDSDPITGEFIFQWSDPESIGDMGITDLGPCGDIPTLTEWGLMIFCALRFGWMAWVIVRRRRRVTVGI